MNNLTNIAKTWLQKFGNAILSTSQNYDLSTKIADGHLGHQDFYNQLCITMYRIIYALIVENNQLGINSEMYGEYLKNYSLYNSNNLNYSKLQNLFLLIRNGSALYGNLPYDSYLFSIESDIDIQDCIIDDSIIEELIRMLISGADYTDFDILTFGNIHERTLEFNPTCNQTGTEFYLLNHLASERKNSGSYYTPNSLVESLLDSGLEPIIERKLHNSTEPLKDLLKIKTIDYACGTGHILLYTAKRLIEHARKYDANINISTIIENCIYGVDLNAISAELCKITLWLFSKDNRKNPSIIGKNILNGNSLVGTDCVLDIKHIPDAAFNYKLGDDKQYAKKLKQINAGQKDNDAISPTNRLKHDLWTASFFLPLKTGTNVLTNSIYYSDNSSYSQEFVYNCIKISKKYKFFHWKLEFPEIFNNGGFDLVISNPPWEVLKVDHREFFESRDNEIAKIESLSLKDKVIEELKVKNPNLYYEFIDFVESNDKLKNFFTKSNRFELTGAGRYNLAFLFAELATRIIAPNGRCAIIVPTNIATDSSGEKFFNYLINNKRIASFFDFENKKQLFPGVANKLKFCLITICGKKEVINDTKFIYFAHSTEDINKIDKQILMNSDDFRLFNPNTRTSPIFRYKKDFEITRYMYQNVPVLDNNGENIWNIRIKQMFQSSSDLEFAKSEDWLKNNSYKRIKNYYTNGSNIYLPMYQGRMIANYDHRSASVGVKYNTTFRDAVTINTTEDQHKNPAFYTSPRYWIPENIISQELEHYKRNWMIGFRDITDSTNERTSIFTILPKCATATTCPIILFDDLSIIYLFANLNSYVFDYVTRQKINGMHLTGGYLKQLPVIPKEKYSEKCVFDNNQTIAEWILPKILQLCYTSWDLSFFASDYNYFDKPFEWNVERRNELIAQINALYFHLYNISEENIEYIMNNFALMKKREVSQYGNYNSFNKIIYYYNKR